MENISRGARVAPQLVVKRERATGADWGIYECFTAEVILIARADLLEKWCAAGLVVRDIFTIVQPDENAIDGAALADCYYIVKRVEARLEYLPQAASPDTLDEALAFATALKNTRSRLGSEAVLSTAIYSGQLGVLLPTEASSGIATGEHTTDAMLLGRYLTGGLAIPITATRSISRSLSWMSSAALAQVADSAAIELDATEIVEARAAETRRESQANREDGVPTEPFQLYGRAELTRFFNDYVIDIARRPAEYARMGIEFPGAILLYGPPGSGKTYAAERLVDYLGWPHYEINSGTIGSTYIHETSKKIAEIFAAATESAPSVVLIDEMESFLSAREHGAGKHIHHTEEVGEFLRLLQRARESHVLVIAMTNMLAEIDPAVKRKGRFDHIIEVGMPSAEEIAALLDKLLENIPTAAGLEVERMARALVGKSMADVSYLVKEAGLRTVRAGKKEIEQSVLDEILAELPQTGEERRPIGFSLARESSVREARENETTG